MIDNIFIGYTEDYITNDLLNILNKLKQNNNGITDNSVSTQQGFQTHNLLEENCIKPYLEYMISLLPSNTLKHRWFHMIDYDLKGYQLEHDHSKTETYSYILYLETSKSGETYFKFNDTNIMYIKPIKNMIVFFPSYLKHGGLKVLDNKKVAVGALI